MSHGNNLIANQKIKHLNGELSLTQSSAAKAIQTMYLKVAVRSPSEFLMIALFEILNKL